ncbi:MAG: DUF2304 domain-containing protein [Propionibacteriaceae bacterium]|nr:DUF2304 domain-containing protein [Propionibacteriaceae bacterium]
MSGYWFAVTLCIIFLCVTFHLLRTKRLKEKYAILWIFVALGTSVIAAFPKLALYISHLVGVQLPANLLFATTIFFLLVVCVQLSSAVSNLEENVRTLAEELALTSAELHSFPTPNQEQPEQQDKTE